MRAAALGIPRTPRFVLLSGHDSGPMAPVLAALRIGGREFPRFGDLIAIELHRRHGPVEEGGAVPRAGDDGRAAGQTMVRVVHNGEVVTRHIPGCPDTALCPFDTFYAAATALVPTPAECGRSDAPDWWPEVGEGGEGGEGDVPSSSLLSIETKRADSQALGTSTCPDGGGGGGATAAAVIFWTLGLGLGLRSNPNTNPNP